MAIRKLRAVHERASVAAKRERVLLERQDQAGNELRLISTAAFHSHGSVPALSIHGFPQMDIARIGRWLCLAGAALGAIGLLGWITGPTALTTIVSGQPPMMPNTALALVLVGVAGALRSSERAGRWPWALSQLAAVLVLAIGLGTLAGYMLVDLPIHHPLMGGEASPPPGRPSPFAGLALTFLAGGLLLLDTRLARRARPSEWLCMGAFAIALTALMAQLHGAGPFYTLDQVTVIGVALHTAVAVLVTSFGLLLLRPGAGLMRLATERGPSGVMLRRLALPVLFGSNARRIRRRTPLHRPGRRSLRTGDRHPDDRPGSRRSRLALPHRGPARTRARGARGEACKHP